MRGFWHIQGSRCQLLLALLAGAWVCVYAVESHGAPEAAWYSEVQAARGERVYDDSCAACHGLQLEGGSSVPLSGAAFQARWVDSGRTVDEFFYIVRTLMPHDRPASLSPQQYIDIVSYVLKVNGYRAGLQELPPDASVLKSMMLRSR
jgi:mono/diheme cytochrome c family protein